MDKTLEEAKEIAKFFASDSKIHDHILAIYTMGSFARGNYTRNSDIDLNIFVKDSSGKLINDIYNRLKETENHFGRIVDNNIITDTSFTDNQINSDIFCQKNRHALFIYETKTSNAFLYGKNILKDLSFEYIYLLPETVKLIQTQVYRLSKLLLAKKPESSQLQTQAIKYVIYSTQFFLINSGYLIKFTEDFRPTLIEVTEKTIPKVDQEFICKLYEKRESRNYILTYEEILHCYDILELLAKLSMKKYVVLRNVKKIYYPPNQKYIAEELKRLNEMYRLKLKRKIIIKTGQPEENIIAKSHLGSVKISLDRKISGDYFINDYRDLDILFRYSKHQNEH